MKRIGALTLTLLLAGNLLGGEKVSSADDEFVIPPIYEEVQLFEDGVAFVKKDGRWGLINIAGTSILQPKYDDVGPFVEGRAEVRVGDTWGYIDHNGHEVIPVQYDYVHNFDDGMSVVSKGNKVGVIDLNGGIVVPIRYSDVGWFSEDMLAVRTDSGFGFVNSYGVEVISPQYEVVSDFWNGIAVVKEKDDALYRFIDKTGKVITETTYKIRNEVYRGMISHDNEGNFWVTDENGMWGFLNWKGDVVVSPQYDYPTGELEIPWMRSDYQYSFEVGGRVIVEKDGKTSMIDTKGDTIASMPQLDGIHYVKSDYSEGFFIHVYLKEEDRRSHTIVFDNNGKKLFQTEDFFLTSFENGKAAVRKDGIVSIIDTKGHILIDGMEYDGITNFEDGIALYHRINNDDIKMGAINEKGQEVIHPDYSGIQSLGDGLYRVVNADQKVGIINEKGEVLVDARFYDITYRSEGLMAASLDGEMWGYIAEPGESYKPSKAFLPTVNAKLITSLVNVDGKNVEFQAYNINDNHYFKLRDVAMALRGSSKPFEVAYDNSQHVINLTSGSVYTAIGSELKNSAGKLNVIALPTTSTIFFDGIEMRYQVYNIEGNNYFKLRDLGKDLNFSVNWDSAAKVVMIDTSLDYKS